MTRSNIRYKLQSDGGINGLLSLKEVLKEKLEKLAKVELKNANCPFMFGEIELPACIKEEMDK